MNTKQIIEDFFGISVNEYEAVVTRRIQQTNGWRSVNLIETLPGALKYEEPIMRVPGLRYATEYVNNENGLFFRYKAHLFNREYKEINDGNSEYEYVVRVFMDENRLVAHVVTSFNLSIFQSRIDAGEFTDDRDLERALAWNDYASFIPEGWLGDFHPQTHPEAFALSTHEYVFEFQEQGANPVYEMTMEPHYEDGVAVFSPVVTKDGEPVENAQFRWDIKSSVPEGIIGRVTDGFVDREIRITTDSRNRGAMFVLTNNVTVTAIYQGAVDAEGDKYNIKKGWSGDLNLPLFDLPI